MANNYQQFSEAIDDITAEEKAWWEEACAAPDMDDTEKREAWVQKFGFAADDEFEYWPDFDWDLDKNQLWVSSPEYSNLEYLAQVVHAFLKQFRRDYTFELGYAQYCDKLRIHEFYGGVVLITAAGIYWSEDAVATMREKVKKELAILSPQPKVDDGRLLRKGNRGNT